MELSMPKPTNAPVSLTSYKVLSFDVYGSLIEYKAHILKSFKPLRSRLPPSSVYMDSTPLSSTVQDSETVGSVKFLQLFQQQEDAIKLEKPVKRFDQLLSEIWRRIAHELDVQSNEEEALNFGSEANIASWPTFNGTIQALQTLSKYYKLVALSNIDIYAWKITAPSSGLGNVNWWKVFTAEDFGTDLKRADAAKLETLISFVTENGIDKEEILHVAQSLGHDHAPAKKLGLSSAFLIGDGPIWGKEAESKMALEKELVGYAWRFPNLQDFATEAETEWTK